MVGLTQDLFLDLASDADQLDFPVIYTIAREGRAGFTPDDLQEDLRPLLDTILKSIPAPAVDVEAPAQMLIASLDYDTHRGRVAIGRIQRGTIRAGDVMLQIDPDGVSRRASALRRWKPSMACDAERSRKHRLATSSRSAVLPMPRSAPR